MVRTQEPGEGAFAVVGADPDRVGEEFAFGLQQPTAGPNLPKGQVTWGLAGGVLRCGQVELRGVQYEPNVGMRVSEAFSGCNRTPR